MNEIIGRMVAAMKATGLDVASWDDETVAELALAGLKAIREPTRAMLEANATPLAYGEVEQNWRAMIDAALAEKPSAT